MLLQNLTKVNALPRKYNVNNAKIYTSSKNLKTHGTILE